MDIKKNDFDYKPDITNYDYVWGSDQDEYTKDAAKSESNEEEDK
ncbi:hypothetical protein [Paenibacillus pectinilyticus]|nr:hypothetical protein [Paenibacillus pectinilyticus]